MSKVTINVKSLKRFSSDIKDSTKGVGKALRQWGVRYRAWTQERFDKFSKGGGNWKKLKRKRRRGGDKTSVLRDLGALFTALTPNFIRAPGQFEQQGKLSIIVGYGGPSRHPRGNATIADIASFHQLGKGNLPVREIIVDPDTSLQKDMAKDMERGLDSTYK